LDYKIQISLQTPFADNKLKINESIPIPISIKKKTTNRMPYHNQVEHHPVHKNVDVRVQVNKFDHSIMHPLIIIQAPIEVKL
jgi:hypothetical protein